jgi:hypothetical protein
MLLYVPASRFIKLEVQYCTSLLSSTLKSTPRNIHRTLSNMAPLAKFPSELEASSYQTPGGGDSYALLRQMVIETAVAMGYDRETMVECGVNWSDHQDPFGHVKNHAYPQFMTMCNMRVIYSFEKQLKERYHDFMNARHIGCLVKSTTLNLKRPVQFPDSVRRSKPSSLVVYFIITDMQTNQNCSSLLPTTSQRCFRTATLG